MKQGYSVCPVSWSVDCNFTGDGKCNERGWACTPPPSPARANFTLMTVCTPERSGCYSVYSVVLDTLDTQKRGHINDTEHLLTGTSNICPGYGHFVPTACLFSSARYPSHFPYCRDSTLLIFYPTFRHGWRSNQRRFIVVSKSHQKYSNGTVGKVTSWQTLGGERVFGVWGMTMILLIYCDRRVTKVFWTTLYTLHTIV